MIDTHLEIHKNETFTSTHEKRWLRWVKEVEAGLGHDLDGDQDANGYSIDLGYDWFVDGLTPAQAIAEFNVLKFAADGWVPSSHFS